MAFSEKFLDELAERNPIEDVVGSYVRFTKKTGANLFGLCPFHNEKTPSFTVSPSRQSYHCFGCGKGGGVINFIMEKERLSFPEAVAFLAKRANMPMPESETPEADSRRKVLHELNADAARFFHACLKSDIGAPAQAYIEKRGISLPMVKRFGLGYAPDSWSALRDAMHRKGYTDRDLFEAGLIKQGKNGGAYDAFRNRLMFPVVDIRGSVIGFSGRILGDGEPKYLNSPETPVFSKSHNLFAMNLAKQSKSGYILLAEGNIDVVSLHQAGFDSAVASLGTSLTPDQARLITRFSNEVVICYDSDDAGRKAAQRAIGILEKLDLKVRVLQLPLPPGAKKTDPDEFIKRNGPDAFRNVLEGSANQVEYRLKRIAEEHPPTGDEGRVDYLHAAAALLASLPSAVEREVYASRVAELAKISPQAVLTEAENLRKKKISAEKKKEVRTQSRPLQAVQPKQREFYYENPRSALAEEGLIRLLYTDPGLARGQRLPPPERFSSPVLADCYRELLRRIESGAPISLAVLAGQFSAEQMDHFTKVINGTMDPAQGVRAMDDYIRIILAASENQGSDDDDLLKLAENKSKKQNGG